MLSQTGTLPPGEHVLFILYNFVSVHPWGHASFQIIQLFLSVSIIYSFVPTFSDSRAPNLGRSTCTMISGCYSPANPSKWTRGSLTSWNLSPRCQETPNTPPVCDPGLNRLTLLTSKQLLLCFLKRRMGNRQTARMMDAKLDETWWDAPHARDTPAHLIQFWEGKSPGLEHLFALKV